mmetsp:Transcript_21757/g.51779  ORF Transcript_21757/g.51779 Transcript_21757/m.51779 type:complete len:493 (+) Transcript_21757:2099-3577(+)
MSTISRRVHRHARHSSTTTGSQQSSPAENMPQNFLHRHQGGAVTSVRLSSKELRQITPVPHHAAPRAETAPGSSREYLEASIGRDNVLRPKTHGASVSRSITSVPPVDDDDDDDVILARITVNGKIVSAGAAPRTPCRLAALPPGPVRVEVSLLDGAGGVMDVATSVAMAVDASNTATTAPTRLPGMWQDTPHPPPTFGNKFSRLLEVVLAVGNILNAATPYNANAPGFRLGVLRELAELKSNDGKTDFARWVLEYIERIDGALVSVSDELDRVPAAAKVDWEETSRLIEILRGGVEDIRRFVAEQEVDDDDDARDQSPPDEKMLRVLKPFVEIAEADVASLSQRVSQAREAYTETLRYLGEEAEEQSDPPPTEFFGRLVNALDLFSTSTAANISERRRLKERDERVARRQRALEAKKREMAARPPGPEAALEATQSPSPPPAQVSEPRGDGAVEQVAESTPLVAEAEEPQAETTASDSDAVAHETTTTLDE